MTSPTTSTNFKKHQFLFGDFILRSDGILLHQKNELHLPPKELEVLFLLLRARGKIVTKEEVFDKIWCKNAASDESLTRCIYVLRRILREDRQHRHIETVYGKGYRFKTPVEVVSKDEKINITTSVAIFPFKTQSVIDESFLHHGLIQGLAKYSYLGLNVFPATITSKCREFNTINELVKSLSPEYYLTGEVTSHNNSLKLLIELVHSKDHTLTAHQIITFDKKPNISTILTKVITLFVHKIPQLQLNKSNNYELDSDVRSLSTNLSGRRELYKFTPESIQNALKIFEESVQEDPSSTLSFCYLAECYISLAQLGMYDHELAIDNSVKNVEKAIELDPSNAQALSLLALLTGLKGEISVANVLFKQAHLLMPDSSDVNYYHALFYFLKGKTKESLHHVESCLEIDSDRMGALMLKLWLTYYSVSVDQAFKLGSNYLQYTGDNNPVIKSMLALFAAMNGNREISKNFLNEISSSNEQGYISVNNIYTRYLIHGRKMRGEILRYLQGVDFNKIKGCLLPLILVAYGRKAMQNHWVGLKKENNVWTNIWIQDPRILRINRMGSERGHEKVA